MIDYIARGPADAPVLMLLHGIGGDATSFTPQLDALSDRWRVVAWNMPGYGATPLPEQMTFPALGETVVELMDQLSIARVNLLGHSIGGMVAQEFAAAHPERLASLVLSATSPAFGKKDGDFQRKFIKARLGALDDGRTMPELADSIVDGLIGEDPDPAGVAIARQCMAGVAADTYRAAMHCLVTFDRRDKLKDIDMPTLLISAEHDGNAPAPMMEKMATYITDSEYYCIAGAGHLANLERPAEFNKVLTDFLGALPERTESAGQ